jgi:hypothetical protein
MHYISSRFYFLLLCVCSCLLYFCIVQMFGRPGERPPRETFVLRFLSPSLPVLSLSVLVVVKLMTRLLRRSGVPSFVFGKLDVVVDVPSFVFGKRVAVADKVDRVFPRFDFRTFRCCRGRIFWGRRIPDDAAVGAGSGGIVGASAGVVVGGDGLVGLSGAIAGSRGSTVGVCIVGATSSSAGGKMIGIVSGVLLGDKPGSAAGCGATTSSGRMNDEVKNDEPGVGERGVGCSKKNDRLGLGVPSECATSCRTEGVIDGDMSGCPCGSITKSCGAITQSSSAGVGVLVGGTKGGVDGELSGCPYGSITKSSSAGVCVLPVGGKGGVDGGTLFD